MTSVSLAAWALVVVPSLCRAEAIASCCAASRESSLHASEAACACPAGACDCRPPARGDDVCIDTCCPMAKPDDAPRSDELLPAASIVPGPITPRVDAAVCAAILPSAPRIDSSALPFHPSDLPLLI